ncbi:hypothetical protein H4R34_005752 [Dimargaris verticillata]|uniref:Queuosine 5'-phosphate N-glycosylase/hydrolase n=1 Tax=Dimargaris verticillata TaxID=2761393 RepID=A0A9W8AWE7_9FUNG|nr:hypothetical protein H4R34_005752 [Dimargaris verticillata]
MVSASDATWAHIFRSETNEPIPLMAQRLRHIREAGEVLQRLYHGSFVHCVTAANHQALALLSLVTRDFASFRDEAYFHDRPVQFYKRAQILIADIWACCEGQGLGLFLDIDEITMFADYRVPQALVYFGVLEYSPNLLKLLRNPTTRLAPGSQHEMEIRGSSIWAVEQVCQRIRTKWATVPGMSPITVNPVLIDFYLWDLAKDHQEEMAHIPIHLTRSPFY